MWGLLGRRGRRPSRKTDMQIMEGRCPQRPNWINRKTNWKTMLISDLNDCEEFIAGDNSILRELFHPDKAKLDLRYSLAHAIVKPGNITALHSLTTSEVYYILSGEGEMQIDDEKSNVKPGQAIYIPPNAKQRIKNIGETNLIFICIVDPAWRVEDETVY